MSLPLNKPPGQSSIRSFFAPKNPTYVSPPPSSSSTNSKPSAPSPSTTKLSSLPQQSLPQSRPPSLHPQASIVPIEPEHVPALRRITSLILPINYPDSFYAQLSNPETSGAFSRVILWTEPNSSPKVIGGLVCRPEPFPFLTPSGNSLSGLYIQSLVLLSPYRCLGLAAACVEDVAASAASSPWTCETVWAHVWTQNEEGLDWYKRRGFNVAGEIKNYYFKLQPGDALVVQRPILVDRQPSVEVGMSYASNQHQPPQHIQSSTTAMAANLPLYAGSVSQPLPPTGAQKPTAPPPPSLIGTTRPPPPSAPGNMNGTGTTPPPPTNGSTAATSNSLQRPGLGTPGTSFQNLRPETEWNDLPADMHAPTPGITNGGSRSGASSRSSSSVAASRKKRDRAYPAAAFGN